MQLYLIVDFKLTVLSKMFDFDWAWIVIGLPAFILAGTVHEYMHAWVAKKLGDYTATVEGRLTLNPLAHIDPFGLILMVIAHFGWMVPVPVNEYNFKKPVRDMALVAIAGPLSNLAMALIGAALIKFILLISNTPSASLQLFLSGLTGASPLLVIISLILYFFVQVNVILAVFNLLPIPPLDGYRVVRAFLPSNLRSYWEMLEKYYLFILAAILLPFSPLSVLFTGYLHAGVAMVNSLLW